MCICVFHRKILLPYSSLYAAPCFAHISINTQRKPTESPSRKPSASPSRSPSIPPTNSPFRGPSSSPSGSPSTSPTTFDILSDEWLYAGNGVSFPSDTVVVFESDSSIANQFGVVITKYAFNDAYVDFQIEYTQTDYTNQTGYQSQLYIFFAVAGTYPETLLQPDNTIGEFLAATVAYVGSKVFDESMGHTWFSGSTGAASIDTRYLNLTLRIKRSDNFIYSYYKTSGGDWVSIGQPVALAQDLHNVPLQFGCRVRKEWKTFHNFNIIATKLAGGSPLPIPTKNPTTSPTETQTWISELPTTQNYGPACHSTLDRSSVSNYPYQTRGIGGGGAMSGLSISPWNSLWFVGTDMGTIFRSTDAGFVWYPVSHYEAKYHSRLVVSASVGYTSDPEIIVHATCDENVASSDCVAQRSVDSGITWNPINITGGTRVDHLGNPVLDEIPKQFYGSLVQNSGLVYCSTFNSDQISNLLLCVPLRCSCTRSSTADLSINS